MVREFKLPDVGEGVAEGELVTWLVDEGDTVTEDQPVAEVETDKALVEVPAPVNGTVRELRAEEGEMVPVGDVIITFDVEGESADEAAAEAETQESEAESVAEPTETEAAAEEVSTPEGCVFAPPRVRRLAREEGVDLSQVTGSGPGGRVTEGDVRAAAEGGADVAEPTEPEPAAESAVTESETSTAETAGTEAPAQAESAERDRTLAAPATRRLAEEEGVDIDAVPAAEERDGEAFVTPEAVREYADAQRQAQEADVAAIEAGEPTEHERREPFKGVRRTIADAMVESKYTAPHVTHHDEVDVTALVETRERLKPVAEEQGIRLTYMPFIVKAVVAALKEFPEMNAVIDEEAEEIVYRDYYNVGIATATDVGLMVPVVDHADGKGMLQLSSEMNELVQKARERTISPEELRGSTFTVTNIGGIGGEYATPVLNYPEAGILAVGEIKRKPRVVTDEDGTESIEPRSVMTLSLSFDHRLIDGAVGARFTNKVMEYLENPELLLLE
ncbi:2-oxo acid dehydrogenase subunit E2 [Natribaculum luteum]|uniref:2-oxo acid dehydrogenase subunit E2 n=1 Tax=Natribaculum luteum TaxID=1586232 RepID=A0ABD5P6M0_9EURY|nr:2-oxo acid dehydrogenase subunit E2 [Natribaculum luteum]